MIVPYCLLWMIGLSHGPRGTSVGAGYSLLTRMVLIAPGFLVANNCMNLCGALVDAASTTTSANTTSMVREGMVITRERNLAAH